MDLFLGEIEFDDPYDKWLTGVPDYDEPFFYGLNWIRSGSYSDEDDDKLDDYFSDEDPNGIYETVVEQTLTVFGGLEITGGTWDFIDLFSLQ